jgi:hypothetical protein
VSVQAERLKRLKILQESAGFAVSVGASHKLHCDCRSQLSVLSLCCTLSKSALTLC